MTSKTLPPDAAERIRWPLRLTRGAMLCENALRAFWPLLTLVLGVAGALMAGVQDVLPPTFAQIGAVGVLGLGTAVLVRGFSAFRLPSRQAALMRLDATLPGQPIAALSDNQAIGATDAASKMVWQAHQARMAARLAGARATWPDLRIAALDPFALRYMALLAFIMAAGFGSVTRITHVAGILPQASLPGAAAASWEGWVEPPAYTGKPSLYLNDQPPGALKVPVGSRLTLRLYGRMGDLTVRETVSGAPPKPEAGPAQPSYVYDVVRDGTVSIDGPGGAEWQITTIADIAPMIRPEGDLTRTLAGELRQGFIAMDDYGVTSGQARITLDLARVDRRYGLSSVPDGRADIVVDLPMPFRGDRARVEEMLRENLATHPWAGLPVVLTLSATDAMDGRGASAPIALTLPGRRFLDALALALIEQRRDLLWARGNAPRVARVLRAISNRPDGLFARETDYLKLRVAIRRLELAVAAGLTQEKRDEVAQALWDIAVQIEDGNLAGARDRLRRAQERVSEALRQNASPEELSELMDDLRRAMQDYAQQLAQQQPQDGGQNGQAQNADGPQISPEDLQAMMDQIEDLMRQGRMDEAQAALDALQDMMDNLQTAQGAAGQSNQSPGQQAMQGLQDSLRQQQGLSDEAFRDLQEQDNPNARAGESGENVGRSGGQGQGQSHTGQGGQGDGQGQGDQGSLSDRQRALGQDLNRQRQDLPGGATGPGNAARDALERAGRAMEGAADALEQANPADALDRQAEAMEALREGMRNLDEALAQSQQQRQQQGQQGATAGRPGDTQNDPLGRSPGGAGGASVNAPLSEGEDIYRRAEELMDDIRRRSGEGSRPQAERDYLKRLLNQF